MLCVGPQLRSWDGRSRTGLVEKTGLHRNFTRVTSCGKCLLEKIINAKCQVDEDWSE